MWEKRIMHDGLSAYRVVKGQTQEDVELKANLQEAIWKERWEKRLQAERTQNARSKRLEQRVLNTEQSAAAKALALERTKELEIERDGLEKILYAVLDQKIGVDWESKKDKAEFATLKPIPTLNKAIPSKPDPAALRFNPDPVVPALTLLDKLVASRRIKKVTEADELNEKARLSAAALLERERADYQAAVDRIDQDNAETAAQYRQALDEWESAKGVFESARRERNAKIDTAKASYLSCDVESVKAYIEEVLSQSEYPDDFPKEHFIEYVAQTRTLVVDYELPNQAVLPRIKEVKYVAARSEFQEVPISDTWTKKTYDELLYQISLRALYELFVSDKANALVSIVFNGWVRSIDRSIGVEVHACIMSLEARKDEFLAINLAQVEPKSCFKKLKGVAASKLIELSPVKPLVLLNREDKRFVDGYAVADLMDERTNLAAMDWLDFENLIREVFEKEFSKGGGEVKITQASRDGGVDAIAFDPDPIRGGKLVIQAKRYTNTVGVAAVRDLFGTVHNEGANKGILVTTSDFGPDAYAFAKDKPLTLISGGELLYLLAQHGHAAKIDLPEAKRIAAESK